ncbi:MAG: hypothetical protein RLZZ422_1964 [Pseudomonadota bacterium]|jgi:uncharacterized protein HemX
MIDKSSQPTFESTLPSSSRSHYFAIFLAALALFFTVVGIGAGYRHWQRMNMKVNAAQVIIQKQQQQLLNVPTQAKLQLIENDLKSLLESQTRLTQERMATIAALEQQTRQFAQTVASQTEQITRIQGQLQQAVKPHTPQGWQIAEVQFLLGLANREWQITHNKEAALAALKEADQLLVNLGVVEYLPVRQQIAQDIGALNHYQGLDTPTITQYIQDLRAALPQPQLLTPKLEQELTVNKPNQRELTWWEQYSQQTKQLFNESFTIRQTDQALPIILDSTASQQIYQLVLVRLETLQLLLLQDNQLAAQDQIQLLIATFNQYYPKTQTSLLIDQLQKISQLISNFDKPDISASLKRLNNINLPQAHEVKP